MDCVEGEDSLKLYKQMAMDRDKMRQIGVYPIIFLSHEPVTQQLYRFNSKVNLKCKKYFAKD